MCSNGMVRFWPNQPICLGQLVPPVAYFSALICSLVGTFHYRNISHCDEYSFLLACIADPSLSFQCCRLVLCLVRFSPESVFHAKYTSFSSELLILGTF
jgi:hypothetical protein